MAISWKRYMAISNILTKDYIAERKITSYEDLLRKINTRDVCPPDAKEIPKEWYHRVALEKTKKTLKKSAGSTNISGQKKDVTKRSPRRKTVKSSSETMKSAQEE